MNKNQDAFYVRLYTEVLTRPKEAGARGGALLWCRAGLHQGQCSQMQVGGDPASLHCNQVASHT